MDNIAVWAALGTFAVLCGGIIVRLIDRINKVGEKAKKDIDGLNKELYDHKLEVARSYVSVSALTQSETKILAAIGDLTTRVNLLFVPKH